MVSERVAKRPHTRDERIASEGLVGGRVAKGISEASIF